MKPANLFQAAIPAALFLVCAYRTFRMVWTGTAPSALRHENILGVHYDAAANPSQFWLVVAFNLIFVIILGYLSWWAYDR